VATTFAEARHAVPAICQFREFGIIADLQAWVDDLRQSRDRWRELALDAKRIADFAEHAAVEAA
jgi:hypothetical protein